MARVVLGLSGGVDSAASAILLQRMGYEVHALWMDNGVGSPDRARACAETLGLPFAVADMREAFEREVCQPFIRSYLAGETPNPCVICNPLVKFRALFDYAEANGCDFVATGHYARAADGFLYRGCGPHDQSYMLYRLPREWVAHCIFPLGSFAAKEDVRAVAGELLPPETSHAAASMDICFIPDGAHWQYIESRGIRPPDGEFVDDGGRVLGTHHGIHRYTVGMRRRLGVAAGERMYVRKIDPAENRITLSPAHEPRESLVEITAAHWFAPPEPGRSYGARVRHSRRMGAAELLPESGGRTLLRVSPECGVPAPGQSAVLYEGEKVLGGGFISRIFDESL